MSLDFGVLDKFYEDSDELFNDLFEYKRRILIEQNFKDVVEKFTKQYSGVDNVEITLKLI